MHSANFILMFLMKIDKCGFHPVNHYSAWIRPGYVISFGKVKFGKNPKNSGNLHSKLLRNPM